MDERGQVLPLVALALVAMAGVGGLVARVGGAVVARERAATAADAAALAGAGGGGAGQATRVAAANGGRVVRYEVSGPQVRVTVTADGATATARARRGSGSGRTAGAAPASARSPRPVGSGATDAPGLAPAMQAALDRAAGALGAAVPVVSGFRSHDQQAWLWSHRATNPYPVAPPGRSAHERGMAVDVPLGFVGRLLVVAGRAGLCQPYPRTDPVHFELCAGG